jgi:sulfate transport system permease protein
MGFTLLYLGAMVALPLAACLWTVTQLGWDGFWAAVWYPPTRAAYTLTIVCALIAAAINVVLGLILAWVLVRYDFWGKQVLDALVDLPLALPTAVAGLVYSELFSADGWYGQFLVPLGIQGDNSRLGIVLVLVFVGLPFVVRALQPVLGNLDGDTEEAAALLGASRWQTFTRVIFPAMLPAILTGFALSLARGLGEYGSVVFISGNIPGQTEIAPRVIRTLIFEDHVKEATAVAVVLLAISFALLLVINALEQRSAPHD